MDLKSDDADFLRSSGRSFIKDREKTNIEAIYFKVKVIFLFRLFRLVQ